jgi:hypothetical protein
MKKITSSHLVAVERAGEMFTVGYEDDFGRIEAQIIAASDIENLEGSETKILNPCGVLR